MASAMGSTSSAPTPLLMSIIPCFETSMGSTAIMCRCSSRSRTAASVLAPNEIKAIRAREHVSQPVFARYLNVSKNLVSDWERGVKKPGGPALRLLTVIQRKGLAAIA